MKFNNQYDKVSLHVYKTLDLRQTNTNDKSTLVLLDRLSIVIQLTGHWFTDTQLSKSQGSHVVEKTYTKELINKQII